MFTSYKRVGVSFLVAFFLANIIFPLQLVCVSAEQNESVIELSAPSAILMEQSSGEILYEKNADEPLPPASVTKVMTMLLTMEAVDSGKIALDDIVTGSEYAKSMGGSTIFLDAGEKISVYDLMKGVAVASGNDAAVALGEHISGSCEGFVELMNNRAKELGMANTQFKNPNGLDCEGHFSSARDIAIMSRELLKHEKIFEFTTIWMDSLRDGKFQLSNTNKLIRFYNGANGLKTGSTSVAKNCISASALRDGMQLIAVVMAAPTSAQRFADAKKLLDYGFANFEVKKVVNSGDEYGKVKVFKGMKGEVCAVAKDNFSALIKKGEGDKIATEVNIQSDINAPVKRLDKIGEISILKGENRIGTVNIVSFEDVEKLTYYAMLSKLFLNWMKI